MDRRSLQFTSLGVYRFEGERLVLCYSQYGARPTGFDSDAGVYRMTLRRARR